MLLNTFHRVFRPVAAPLNSVRWREDERDPLSVSGARASLSDSDGNEPSSQRNSSSGDHHVDGVRVSLDSLDSTPLLARKHSSQPSTSTATTVTVTVNGDNLHAGPSHVFWKTPHSGSATITGLRPLNGEEGFANSSPVLWGSHPLNRSASSPSLPSPPPNALGPREYRSSSLGRQSSRSLKLPRDSLSASEDSDVESERNEHHALPKQLSPIHEQQVPFPPHRKLSMDSVPRTPDSIRTFDRITTHSTASAFINRPLKRSVSQTSTSTHFSTVSSPTPPVIPPLDLRPNFQTAMGVPHGAQSPIIQAPTPRKSRLPAPTLPTVIGSPRQMNMVSVIYEDGASTSGRTSSYATAPASPNTPTAGSGERLSLTDLANLIVNPDDIVIDPNRGSATDTNTGETVDTDDTQHGFPSDTGLRLRDSSGGPRSDGEPELEGDADTRPNSRTGLRVRPQNPIPPSTHSGTPRNSGGQQRLRSRSATSSRGESFFANLEQRWLKGLSFGSGRFLHPPPERKGAGVTHAFVLFWVGFIAPWCWLIGGWLLSRDGEAFEPKGPLLPLWHRRRKGKHFAVPNGSGGSASVSNVQGAIDHQRIKATSWYPLLAPSVESLAPSTHSLGSAHKLKRHSDESRRPDPWIARCRVAATVSGVLIFSGFVVAMVFAAGVRA